MVKLDLQKTIKSEEELRSLLGYPSEMVSNKAIHYLDNNLINFIDKSPMLFLATSDIEGNCDTSPRGDMPGFVYIVDEKHLVIPERPGNRRMDSLSNILSNPSVGLLFVIPGLEETVRINGRAFITKDEHILERLTAFGKSPLLGIVVRVEECYLHCAKAFKRSNLWNPVSWPKKQDLPNPAKILTDHVNLPRYDENNITEALKESYSKRLY